MNNPRSSPHGISLTSLSEPLNFGPALVPTLQPTGTPTSVSASNEATTTSSSGSPSRGLFPIDPDAVDSFLGQQSSPPASSSIQTPSSKPQAQSFLSTSSSMSSTPQQKTQSGPKHFTMSGAGHDSDNFFTPSTQAPPSFMSPAVSKTTPRPQMSVSPLPSIGTSMNSGIQTGMRAPVMFTPPAPTSTSSQPLLFNPASIGGTQSTIRPPMSFPASTPPLQTNSPLIPPAGQPGQSSRRVYPQAPQQSSYTQPQYPAPSIPSFPPPMSSSIYQPVTQSSTLPSSTQLPQSSYQPSAMIPTIPQHQTQTFLPQRTQQFPSYPASGEAPVLPVVQQGESQEGVVPSMSVAPVQPHWFYLKDSRIWMPFSFIDSDNLEHSHRVAVDGKDRIVPTDGGRYDVSLEKRSRESVYWEEPATVVRRCTWFYKGDGGTKFIPYDEDIAEKLENEFQSTVHHNLWPRRIDLSNGEYVIIHNTNVMVHFKPSEVQDWSGEDIKARPMVVRRGIFDIEDSIDDGEPSQIDHLVFVVHGIGPIADLRFRNIVECVDDLRMVTLSMMTEHHDELAKGRTIGRIEYLPVQWHSKLHNDSTGVDERLHSISLKSITKLRDFTNSTLLDILFYTSPTYCQTIVDVVGSEMARLLEIFRKRNPLFKGKISVCGHSLGSSIMFDILFHQKDESKPPAKPTEPESNSEPTNQESSEDEEDEPVATISDVLNQLGLQDYEAMFESEKIDMETLITFSESDLKEMDLPMGPRKKISGFLKQHSANMEKSRLEKAERVKAKAAAKAKIEEQSKDNLDSASCSSLETVESVEVLYHLGVAGTGQPNVRYPKLDFKPFAMFALGSPIGMFMTVRGVDHLGPDYQLPTCQKFYNIFHPFDPVAYRVEPLVDSTFALRPVMLPHHKGRKRMHLELWDNLSRFGAQLKATLHDSVKSTLESINEFARAHTTTVEVAQEVQVEPPSPARSAASDSSEDERTRHELTIKIGQLNGGDRIDYVLQEKPIESLNEYLFALSSHVCYWLVWMFSCNEKKTAVFG
ncbi:SEC23-interacting protein [Exaiptasia diaphana]|nr:SEC23-interacting protein [Exaiptasia diaphana]